MFLKYFEPFTKTYRNKVTTPSTLCSKKITKKIPLQFFKQKNKKNRKFLSNTNKFYVCNLNRNYIGIFNVIKVFKTSYSNSFFSVNEFSNDTKTVHKLFYGFSLTKNYTSPQILYKDFFKNSFFLQKKYLFYFDVKEKFSLLNSYLGNLFFATSAGTFCMLKNKEASKNIFHIQIPSSILKVFCVFSTAYLGRISNIYSKYRVFSSFSGKFIIKKKFQSTRGVAKNPVDHPNGGRSKIKHPFKTPWGFVAKKGKILFKINKFFFFNSVDFYFLKKKKNFLWNSALRINVFMKKKKYVAYCGNRLVVINVRSCMTAHKLNQFLITKKPFSGPIKKFKIFGKIKP